MGTLLRGEETTTNDTTTAVQKQVELTTEESSSNIVATDLESRPFWIYDFQETIPLDVETRGTEIRPGDKIQVSCIYDSNYRDSPTNFGLSTYDEMCITTLQVTFETPQELSFWQGALMEPNNCEYEYSDDFFSDDAYGSESEEDEDIMCAADVQECSDGSFVSRDPTNDCEFPACPSDDTITDTTEVMSSANGGAFGKLISLVSIA